MTILADNRIQDVAPIGFLPGVQYDALSLVQDIEFQAQSLSATSGMKLEDDFNATVPPPYYYQLSGKILYRESDIQKMRDENYEE
jgi:hypothetical protein